MILDTINQIIANSGMGYAEIGFLLALIPAFALLAWVGIHGNDGRN